ncbi:MAG: peptidylprolyl isomerase [Nitratireductor sp.]
MLFDFPKLDFFAPILVITGLAMGLSACTGSTAALDTAKPKTSVSAQVSETSDTDSDKTDGATVIRQESTVARKGTYIKILVNGQPITNYDIQRRAKFRQVRRLKATSAETEKELIDERLKLQEASKRGLLASDAQVNAAFANFAQNNRSTPAKISSDLDRIGIGSQHFKEFIRAQISWSRTFSSKLQSEAVSKNESNAIFDLRKSGSSKPQTTEYQLKEIIFVVPQDKRKSMLKTRKQEALAFQQRFSGCDTLYDQIKGLRDVAIKDAGRLMQPELPPLWKKEIEATSEGQTTPPKETEKGIELIAVCRARLTSDDRAAEVMAKSELYDSLEAKGDSAADDYLAELRKSATIIYK